MDAPIGTNHEDMHEITVDSRRVNEDHYLPTAQMDEVIGRLN